jgi:glycerophosphoryl diester phosphodiesterase
MTSPRFASLGILVAALTAMLVACSSSPTTTGPAVKPVFDAQGHRGARGLAPENTLAAFDRAMREGVHTLELDVGITKDGVVIVGHDPKLNGTIVRDEQGRWIDSPGPAIASLTLAQLQRYDVGRIKPDTRYAQTYVQQQPHDGQRMPTLAQVFELVKARGATHMRFNIETKLSPDDPQATTDPATFVRTLLAVLDAHGMAARTTIQSFDWRTLREVHRQAPAIDTVCLTVRQNWMDNVSSGRWTLGITPGEHGNVVPRMVKAAGCAVWSPYFGDVDTASVDESRRLKLSVVPWTVNAVADIERVIDLKVDGIISDYPDRVREVMRRRGMSLPPTVAR